MSSRSGDPCKCPQIDLHRQLCCERRPYLTDYRSSPDLLDVQQVRWALLGSRPLPDLPDVQWVGLASEAFAQSKMSGCRCWQSYWRSISQGILLSNLTKCAAPYPLDVVFLVGIWTLGILPLVLRSTFMQFPIKILLKRQRQLIQT